MPPDSALRAGCSAAEAEALAHEHYGFPGRAEPLPGEYDDNFRLRTSDGRTFVLKLMHPERERALVELQIAALRHAERADPALRLPRVQRARDGSDLVTTRDRAGRARLLWLLDHLAGTPLAAVRPRSDALHLELGAWLARFDRALVDFDPPAARRTLKWDLAQAGWIRSELGALPDPHRRTLVATVLDTFTRDVEPELTHLPVGVIHGDANDHNVLVRVERAQPLSIASVIDLGDLHRTARICELAIAGAYALLDQPEPLRVLAALVRGYHGEFVLQERELAVLFPLVQTRLAVSVVNSALRQRLAPDDPYVTISEAPAWRALERLATLHPREAHYALRAAAGLPPVPHGPRVARWLTENRAHFVAPLELDLVREPLVVLDLSVGSLTLGADPRTAASDELAGAVARECARLGARAALGRYDEVRLLYSAPLFAGARANDERRTLHIGLDLFVPPGSVVRAPLPGRVHALANQPDEQDYGGVVVLEHATDAGERFFTLYGHLAPASFAGLEPGQALATGTPFARVGTFAENGGWAPHLHFQLLLDDLGRGAGQPGVARASERTLATALYPDPNLLLGIPEERFPPREPAKEQLLAARRARIVPNVRLAHRADPLDVRRGWKTKLYDADGRAYLDVYNNVPLVGHSHPRVVAAAQRQLALLNTNTRYLHPNLVRYAERLCALLPRELSVCAVVNSGSEANELALRLARAHTRTDDVIVLAHAYHGHTTTLIDVSPYKFDGPGGGGKKPWVHVAPLPDDYRGPYGRDDPARGAKYAAGVAEIVAELRRAGLGPAAFLAETLPSVGGQVVLPPGYLRDAYAAVRAAGGVCIADEVQVGFGRLGSCFFGFESQDVVPDIVVLGKPIGNGFPLAAVVTTPTIAASFDRGMEFFSTFGGNPVACAAGLAVLDVLRDERLQENALAVGTYLKERLAALAAHHPLIGDVRGMGLFLGVELVRDQTTLEPAAEEADHIVQRLREEGILAGTDGPWHSVLKLRPPLCFTRAEADIFVAALDEILGEDALRT